jgi:molybdopterin-guanine dinucleotide biosynthesis protein MobB
MNCPPETSASGSAPASPARRALAIVGFSNAGKTELICRLLAVLAARGLRVAVLKHSHHADLDPDRGKDTWRYRQAGARTVGLAAPGFLQVTRTFPGEPSLEQSLAALEADADLILVEGYKSGPLPKIAVLTPEAGEIPDFPNLIALVTSKAVESPLPAFGPSQVEELGQWLYDYLIRD